MVSSELLDPMPPTPPPAAPLTVSAPAVVLEVEEAT
jgi:hypothetical protein